MKKLCDNLLKVIDSNSFLFVTFIVSIVVMLMCQMSCIQISVPLTTDVIDGINGSLFSIAGSYVAGYFFYILSVIVPHKRRRERMIGIISEYIKYSKGKLCDLSNAIFGKYDMSEIPVNDLVLKLAKKENDDDYRMTVENGRFISQEMAKAFSLLSYLFSEIDYLKVEDVDIVQEIVRLELQINTSLHDKMESCNSFLSWGKDEIEKLAKSLLELYNLVNKLNKGLTS